MSLGQSGIPEPQKTTTSSPSSQFNQPFLGAAEQALGEQIFRTAASPLQEAFKEQQKTGEELLAQRGVQFGGLGSESRRKLAESQQRALTGLAGQIASNLGQSALERAFASSEAAKARQFTQEEAERGRKFSAEEAARAREFGVERGLLERALEGGLDPSASQDIFDKFGIDPNTVRIDGQTLEEYQEAQRKLSEAELADALQDKESVLREELTFAMLQAGVNPKDIPDRLTEIFGNLGLEMGLGEGEADSSTLERDRLIVERAEQIRESNFLTKRTAARQGPPSARRWPQGKMKRTTARRMAEEQLRREGLIS